MARYGQWSQNHVNEPGQYPTTAWNEFGLPEQNFGSGAAGSTQPSAAMDEGSANEPGQYPDRDDFTGVPYSLGGTSGSGAPGSTGIAYDGTGGSDTITYSKPTFYKGMREDGQQFSGPPAGAGYDVETIQGQVSGEGDWTQANPTSYGPGWNMPGVEGNTPVPGSGQHQTDGQNGSGHVLYGGFLRGQRPGTSRHPAHSGPGT
jgi:hypothetical protein